MPDIPKYSRQRVPSGQVSATPLPYDIANTGEAAIGKGLQAVGAGVTDVATTKARLMMEEQKLADDVAELKLKSLRDIAEIKIKEGIANQADTDFWGGIVKKELQGYGEQAAGYRAKMSRAAVDRIAADDEAWSGSVVADYKHQATLQDATEAVILHDNRAIADIQRGGKVEDIKKSYLSGVGQYVGVEEAKKRWRTLSTTAQNSRLNSLVSELVGAAAENPQKVKDAMREELARRKKGKGSLLYDEIPSDKLQQILNAADAAGSRQEKIANAEAEAARDTLTANIYTDIFSTEADAASTEVMITNAIRPDKDGNSAITVEQAELLRRVNEREDAVVTSNAATIELEGLISQVRTGDVSTGKAMVQAIPVLGNTSDVDGKSFIRRLFEAEKAAEDDVQVRQEKKYQLHVTLLRSSVTGSASALFPTEGQDVYKRLADEAQIELNKQFEKRKFTDAEIGEAVDTLAKQYRLSLEQVKILKRNEQATRRTAFEEKKTQLRNEMQQLIDQGKTDEAKAAYLKAKEEGLFRGTMMDVLNDIAVPEDAAEQTVPMSAVRRLFQTMFGGTNVTEE